MPPIPPPRRLLAAALPLVGLAAAQVQTKCNPLERSDCLCDPALGAGADEARAWDRAPPPELWEATAGRVAYDGPGASAAFTVARQGYSSTLRSTFYVFFGRAEVWLRAARGRGIVSSVMWLSDALDELDWELLGANDTHATINFFAKSRQDFGNDSAHPLARIHDDFHNYTTVWTRDRIDWHIDGARVRSLRAGDAVPADNFPQTPMRLSVGIWAGGDTDYAAGPYTMYVQRVHVTDFSLGSEYAYGDQSGSWQSIRVEP